MSQFYEEIFAEADVQASKHNRLKKRVEELTARVNGLEKLVQILLDERKEETHGNFNDVPIPF